MTALVAKNFQSSRENFDLYFKGLFCQSKAKWALQKSGALSWQVCAICSVGIYKEEDQPRVIFKFSWTCKLSVLCYCVNGLVWPIGQGVFLFSTTNLW